MEPSRKLRLKQLHEERQRVRSQEAVPKHDDRTLKQELGLIKQQLYRGLKPRRVRSPPMNLALLEQARTASQLLAPAGPTSQRKRPIESRQKLSVQERKALVERLVGSSPRPLAGSPQPKQ